MMTTKTPATRLRRAGLTGALVAGALFGSTPMAANAAIIVDSTPVTWAVGYPDQTINIGGTDVYTIYGYTDKSGTNIGFISANGFAATGPSGSIIAPVAPGQMVGPGTSYVDDPTGYQFIAKFSQIIQPGTTGYFGFKFTPVGTENVQYGYTKFSLSDDKMTLTLIETAFENSGAPITIPSPAPEPSTWLMMVIGFGIVGAGMRRSHRATPVAGGLAV